MTLATSNRFKIIACILITSTVHYTARKSQATFWHLRHFCFWAKIAHFSLIFTPESFCKKASGKQICFPPPQLPFFIGQNWYQRWASYANRSGIPRNFSVA
jgi:hypothetical protein